MNHCLSIHHVAGEAWATMRRSSGVFLTLPARLRLASAGTSARAVAHALGLRLLRPLWRRHDRVVQSHGLPAGVGAARRKTSSQEYQHGEHPRQLSFMRHVIGMGPLGETPSQFSRSTWTLRQQCLANHHRGCPKEGQHSRIVAPKAHKEDITPASWSPRRARRTAPTPASWSPRRGPGIQRTTTPPYH